MTGHVERIEQLPVGLTRLWLGVLLAPGAWVLAEAAGYYLAARSCELGVAGVPLLGTAQPRATHIIVCLVALAGAVTGLWIALQNWRAVGDRPRSGDAPELGRARFMSFGGVLLSVLFAGGIVLFAFPGLIVNACSQAR